jgi:hypothetical protein
MNDEKENLPQSPVQLSEPSQPFTPRMKFDSGTEKYISELHPDVAVLAREHLSRIVERDTRSKESQRIDHTRNRRTNTKRAASVIRGRLSQTLEPV